MDDHNPKPTAGFRWRPLAAALAALVCLIPIGVGVLLVSGSGASVAGPTPSRAAVFTPIPAKIPPLAGLLLPAGTGSLVASVAHPTAMRSSPGGRVDARLTTHTEFGTPEALWVVRLSGRWLGVVSPLAGNGRVGWIPAAAVALKRVSWKLKVSLSERQLTVLQDGRVRERYKIAIGRPDAPTPTGRFAVTDRLNTGDPAGPYGCCILALSAKAPHAISGWDGGDRIAIHSTPETWTIGQPVSHGCMRLTLAEGRWLLDHIPLGTPTLISS